MKTLTQDEFEKLVSVLQELKGFEVQGIYGTDSLFGLKLWSQGISWITVNLKGDAPFLYGPEELVKFQKGPVKPVFTFFNKYMKQAKLKEIFVNERFGRVVEILFESKEYGELKIELRLFRGGANLGVFANNKQVFLNKPTPLEERTGEALKLRVSRDVLELKKEIVFYIENKRSPLKVENVDKKKIAMNKVKEAIIFHESDPYLRLAQLLERNEKPTPDLKKLLQKDKSDQENIGYCYEQHKLKDQKIERLKRRVEELQRAESVSSPKLKPEIQGIPRIELAQNIRAFCGRKAKENIELIRKAKAWYVWMHLKDYPSAHVVIEKNKHKELTEGNLKKAALFLFSRGAPRKLASASEVKFEVIFTECRHVRPVKGDKLGRVTAQNVKSRVYVWKKEDKFSF